MKTFRGLVALLGLFTVASCRSEKPAAGRESTAVVPPAPPESAATPGTAWDPAVGPILLVATDSPTRAFVLRPHGTDQTPSVAIPHPASVTLFSRSGSVQTADLPAAPDTSACSVATLEAAPPPRPWSVGFIGGVVAPVPVDSTESLAPKDSAAMVTWLNRMASGLPNDSAGRFVGLPFVVRSIWRFALPDGRQILVGTLMRQINQEATPLQERTFLIGEQPPRDSGFVRAYSERSSGDEETVASTELVAALLLGESRRATIVVARDFGNATGFGLIERTDAGQWQAVWSTTRRQC
jgi:hypothetical protein